MRHSHATHDLVNHIADGEFPSWDFCIQTMDLSEEHTQEFDPLDCTKVGSCLLYGISLKQPYSVQYLKFANQVGFK